jgi:S1-C subfamily serine protease
MKQILAAVLAAVLTGCAAAPGPKQAPGAPVPCYSDSMRPANVYSKEQVAYSYRPSAEAGIAMAQYNLGNALLLGAGVARDEAEAAHWYQAAVERGHAGAAFYLAALTESGRGTAQDWTRARQLFLRAAEAGDVKAAECTGRYYAGVAGTGEVDAAKAALWFEIAARARQREDPAYRGLKPKLSAEQIAAARKQALSWRPTPMPVTAAATAPEIAVAPEPRAVRAGSGVLVGGGSHVLTNAHVVVGCQRIAILDADGIERPAATAAVDLSDDVAVLRSIGNGMAPRLIAATDPTVGMTVTVIGFPLPELFGNRTAKIWTGMISETTGPDGNGGFLRMTAPVLQGLSGGPVLDERGRLVGLVIGTRDPAKVASLQPVDIGGISYAVKATRIRWLLDRHGLGHLLETPPADGGLTGAAFALSQGELAALGRAATVYVECRR